jgi:SAM-dependent methyltransferase
MQIKPKDKDYYFLQNGRSVSERDNNKLPQFFNRVEVEDINTFAILDIGCRSHANTVREFLQKGFVNTYGLDIGEKAQEKWQNYSFKSHLKRGDIHEGIPFDTTFNLISCSHTLEHCYDPELVLKIIYTNLKQGGYYWGQVPVAKSEDVYGHSPHYCYFESPAEHCSFISQVGFEIIFEHSSNSESCVLGRKV